MRRIYKKDLSNPEEKLKLQNICGKRSIKKKKKT